MVNCGANHTTWSLQEDYCNNYIFQSVLGHEMSVPCRQLLHVVTMNTLEPVSRRFDSINVSIAMALFILLTILQKDTEPH